jgi:uncharacterized protein YecE (DUF72 family)
VEPLARAGKLSYVLFQFAPWVSWSDPLRRYLAGLRKRLKDWPVAVEFRNPSWIPARTEETLSFLEEQGLAHTAVDAPWMPLVPRATGPLFLLRCHGRNEAGWKAQMAGKRPTVSEKYDYRYSDEEVLALAERVRGVRFRGPSYIVFNNNNRDYPIQNALQARRSLGQPARGVEEGRRLYGRPAVPAQKDLGLL